MNKLLAQQIFAPTHFQPLRITVCYWKEKIPGQYAANRFPVFVQHPAVDNFGVYGLPSEEYPGHVKVIFIFYRSTNIIILIMIKSDNLFTHVADCVRQSIMI